jgi:hypothetical protein
MLQPWAGQSEAQGLETTTQGTENDEWQTCASQTHLWPTNKLESSIVEIPRPPGNFSSVLPVVALMQCFFLDGVCDKDYHRQHHRC